MLEQKMLNYFCNVLLTSWLITCVLAQSEYFCSKKEVPWMHAIEECLNAYGTPMSFHGVTGKTIETINLRHDVTAWTSDYLYSDGIQRGPCLCRFQHLSEDFYKASDELYSYCDDFRYIFCRNKTNNIIELLNNTWSNVYKCGTFPVNIQLLRLSIFKPGYYWTRNSPECGFYGLAAIYSQVLWQTQAVLCGAYSKDAGRHFRRCNTTHRLVCVSSERGLRSDLFDDSCFKDTTTSESVSRTSNLPTGFYSAQAGFKTEMSKISTRTIKNSSETQMMNNSTLRDVRLSADEHGDRDRVTDAAIIAGIVVGVSLSLVAVIVLFIFMYRRCFYQRRSPDYVNGEVSRNEHGTENALFDTMAGSVKIGVGDTHGGEQCSKSAERSENIYIKVEKLNNAPEHCYSTLSVQKFVK